MQAKLLSFTVQATVVDEDDTGSVVGRLTIGPPQEVFGPDGLTAYAEFVHGEIEKRTAALQAAQELIEGGGADGDTGG